MDSEIELRELLSKETVKQKRSYRRTTMLIALVALGGAAWLAFSAINVIRLERKTRGLKAESAELKQQIDSEKLELEARKADLAKADEALQTAKTKLEERKPQEALEVVSNAINVRKATPSPTPTPRPSPSVETNSILFQGNQSLEYIERHIYIYQLQNSVVLVSLSAQRNEESNTASFTAVNFGSHIPMITLIPLPPGREQDTIKAQLAQGKTFITRTSIFVNGRLTKIAAFKKIMTIGG